MDIGVLTAFTALLVIIAFRFAYRALMKRRDGLAQRSDWWPVAIITAAALVCGYIEASFHHRQQLVSEALGVLVPFENVRANCARVSEEMLNISRFDGYVYFDGSNVAHLRRDICLNIASYANGGQANPSWDQVGAVQIVAHEAMHILGFVNESETECRAVQLVHRVAEFLGATPEQARALQAEYYQDHYPRLPDNYTSSQCREGGALDYYPGRTEFP